MRGVGCQRWPYGAAIDAADVDRARRLPGCYLSIHTPVSRASLEFNFAKRRQAISI
jgi:hypothetical protein